MIVVENLVKYYGEYQAVRGVSFEVPKGRVVGFLGPNGAGKSTTMRCLAGFLTASSGSARIAGYDVFNDPIRARRQIGYMPESCPLYPEMRVDGIPLKFRGGLKGLGRSRTPQEAARTTSSNAAGWPTSAGNSSGRCRRATASGSGWPTPCSPTRRC